jgi:hypothetical protein
MVSVLNQGPTVEIPGDRILTLLGFIRPSLLDCGDSSFDRRGSKSDDESPHSKSVASPPKGGLGRRYYDSISGALLIVTH